MIIERQISDELVIMNGKAAKGAGTAQTVPEYARKQIVIATEGMAPGDSVTIKFYGSDSTEQPTWVDGSNDPAAATPTNKIFTVAVLAISAPTLVNGADGVVVANSNGVFKYEINDDGLMWINALITTYTDVNSSTKVSVTLRGYSNV